jgi:hypothetical protein
VIKSTEVKGIGPDGKPRKEYVALIVPRIHPLVDEIVNRFDEEIQMFNDNKPNDSLPSAQRNRPYCAFEMLNTKSAH